MGTRPAISELSKEDLRAAADDYRIWARRIGGAGIGEALLLIADGFERSARQREHAEASKLQPGGVPRARLAVLTISTRKTHEIAGPR